MIKNIKNFNKLTIQDRYEHLLAVISSQRFLQKQGLGNEVPFFICEYKIEESIKIEELQRKLIKQLSNLDVKVLSINLYDLSIKILKSREIWDRILEMEQSVPKAELKELLQGVLDPENHLVPAIAEKMANSDFDVLFLSGVGEVFPYIRSHNVLNNLQSAAKDKPTVIFFPGEYILSSESGAALCLFGRLHDDKYYRAFNIFQFDA
jgi:hypothetical protein